VRKFVGRMLEKAGYRVKLASDGLEALEIVALGGIDLIISDLEMPRTNGYELLMHLRQDPALRQIPVMVVTSRAGAKHRERAMAESLRPDVISMDIMMPHVDGLQATEAIMSKSPRPIVIVSSEARDGAEPTLKALELGAIDFVPKPSSGIDLDMNSIRDEI